MLVRDEDDLFGEKPKKTKRRLISSDYDQETRNRRRALREHVEKGGARVPRRNCRTEHFDIKFLEASTPLEKLKVLASADYHLVVIENQEPTVSCQHCQTTVAPVLTNGTDVTCFDCLLRPSDEGRYEFRIVRDRRVLGDMAMKESRDLLDYIEKRVALEMLLDSKSYIQRR